MVVSQLVPVGSNVQMAVSGNTYNVTTTGVQQFSDVFALPATQLARPGAWFRFTHIGSFIQGATPQAFTLSCLGNPGGIFSPFTITTAMAPANATYAYELIAEWTTRDNAGNGNFHQRLLLTTAASTATPSVLESAAFMTQPFNVAAHGSNVDAYTLFVGISLAAVGPSCFSNMNKFEWMAGSQAA